MENNAQQSQIGEVEQTEELGYQCSLKFTIWLQLFFQGRSLGICKKLAKRLSNALFSIWQLFFMYQFFGLPDGSVGKESAWDPPRGPNAGLIPGSRRSPGGGNDKLLQYSCLKNPMDRGAWQATVQRVAKSQTQLSG